LHGGARFKGLEKLLGYLHDVAHAFQEDPNCSRLAFLLTRCVADFETATEATLSGYLAVARDSMRDVMEIENLFLDFVVKPENIDTWLTGTRTTLKNYFKPVAVRERLHAAGVGRFTDSAYSADYAAHSEALHVTPHRYILDQKGFTTDGWAVDLGFSEIFEHFKRLQIAIARLTDVLSPGSSASVVAHKDLHDVQDAWERTQQTQELFLELIQASDEVLAEQDARGEDNDPGQA